MLNLKTTSSGQFPIYCYLNKSESSLTYSFNIVPASLRSSIFSSTEIELKHSTVQHWADGVLTEGLLSHGTTSVYVSDPFGSKYQGLVWFSSP